MEAIPERIDITSDLKHALQGATLALLCCTSQSMRPLVQNLKDCCQENRELIIVSAVKGLELNSLKRMSEIISEILPDLAVCARCPGQIGSRDAVRLTHRCCGSFTRSKRGQLCAKNAERA